MGNALSNTNLSTKIDEIASKYILSQNFNDMNKLSEKAHCDKVVILTSRILKQNLNPLEQKEVLNRIGNKSEAPDCVEIAKFYVKIAHLYAAIMKTINPVITTTDENGVQQKYDLMSYPKMPSTAEITSIEHTNFCTRRLNSLFQDRDYKDAKRTLLAVNPQRICDINVDKNKKPRKFYQAKNSKNYSGGKPDSDDEFDSPDYEKTERKKEKGNEKGDEKGNERADEGADEGADEKTNKRTNENSDSVTTKPVPMLDSNSEIGIPELRQLYYDVYDPAVNDFTSMSADMKKIYERDVAIFYKTFKGEPVPTDENGQPTIKSFEEIPLREYQSNEKCKPGGMFTQAYEGPKSEALFKKYVTHIDNMKKRMTNNQDKLLSILNQLFIFPMVKEEEKKNTQNPATQEPATQEPATQNPATQNPATQEPATQEQATQEQGSRQGSQEQGSQEPATQEQGSQATQKPSGGGTVETAVINPNLKDAMLPGLINTTRQLIVDLYITCETDFLEGITLMEGIIAAQLAKTTTSQLKLLNSKTIEYLARA